MRRETGLSKMQEREVEQVEQMEPCFERPVSPSMAAVFRVEAEVRLCLGKRKQWQESMAWRDSRTQSG